MAKGGGFEGFLNIYTKAVWAIVGTLLVLGLLCATFHMHKGCDWPKCPKVAQKK